MSREYKPKRMWAVSYMNGSSFMPDTIRRTKKESIAAACEGTPFSWERWQEEGCKVVRVLVQQEPTP